MVYSFQVLHLCSLFTPTYGISKIKCEICLYGKFRTNMLGHFNFILCIQHMGNVIDILIVPKISQFPSGLKSKWESFQQYLKLSWIGQEHTYTNACTHRCAFVHTCVYQYRENRHFGMNERLFGNIHLWKKCLSKQFREKRSY